MKENNRILRIPLYIKIKILSSHNLRNVQNQLELPSEREISPALNR